MRLQTNKPAVLLLDSTNSQNKPQCTSYKLQLYHSQKSIKLAQKDLPKTPKKFLFLFFFKNKIVRRNFLDGFYIEPPSKSLL